MKRAARRPDRPGGEMTEAETLARRIREQVEENVNCRKSLEWDRLDDSVLTELRADVEAKLLPLIREALRNAAASERERCARVADARADEQRSRCEAYAQSGDERGESLSYCALTAVTAVATAIRSLGDADTCDECGLTDAHKPQCSQREGQGARLSMNRKGDPDAD